MLCLDEFVATATRHLWMVVDADSRLVRHVQHGTDETVKKQLLDLCNRFVLPRQLLTDNGSRRRGGDADVRR